MVFAYDSRIQKEHLQQKPGREIEFNRAACEIAILDRRGRTVWYQRRISENDPIRWQGLDRQGQPVEIGQYLLRITYPKQEPIYVPFIIG